MHLPHLGSRGQGWVWGQFVLAAAVLLTAGMGPHWPWAAVTWLGAVLLLSGLVIGIWSLRCLGNSLSPYPQPRGRGELIVHGPYRVVRHPIYSSMLLALVGVCLVGSWWGLLPLVVLVLWWLAKAALEEEYLRAAYPGYADYCRSVRARLIPGLL